MQKEITYPPVTLITPEAPMSPSVHGGRAKCLQRLIRLNMPVPTTVALSFGAVQSIAHGQLPDMDKVMAPFGEAPLLSVRPSSQDPDWGGPGAILNIGMNDERHARMSGEIGAEAATALYCGSFSATLSMSRVLIPTPSICPAALRRRRYRPRSTLMNTRWTSPSRRIPKSS